jgi:hypothetical protein
MLTVDQINTHLARIEHKRGYTWQATEDLYGEGIKVRIVATEPDAFKPGETIDLGVDSCLSPNDMVCGETLDVWLEWRTRRIASHENRENLQRDGRPIFDPHASEKPRKPTLNGFAGVRCVY